MRRTPLYDAHRTAGARMVDFAGWEMPVQYTGIIEEHTAVRTRAGLFDVSHMGEIEIRGPGAEAACQRATANDVTRLAAGQAQYSLLLTPAGGIVVCAVMLFHAQPRALTIAGIMLAGIAVLYFVVRPQKVLTEPEDT